MAHLLESFDALDKLKGFVSTFGRRFYHRDLDAAEAPSVILRKSGVQVVEEKYGAGEDSIVPFWAGKEISWKIVSN